VDGVLAGAVPAQWRGVDDELCRISHYSLLIPVVFFFFSCCFIRSSITEFSFPLEWFGCYRTRWRRPFFIRWSFSYFLFVSIPFKTPALFPLYNDISSCELHREWNIDSQLFRRSGKCHSNKWSKYASSRPSITMKRFLVNEKKKKKKKVD
jgi:hypothetical protein